jgi:hypothetical protein
VTVRCGLGQEQIANPRRIAVSSQPSGFAVLAALIMTSPIPQKWTQDTERLPLLPSWSVGASAGPLVGLMINPVLAACSTTHTLNAGVVSVLGCSSKARTPLLCALIRVQGELSFICVRVTRSEA